jgi:hypothetical protein
LINSECGAKNRVGPSGENVGGVVCRSKNLIERIGKKIGVLKIYEYPEIDDNADY